MNKSFFGLVCAVGAAIGLLGSAARIHAGEFADGWTDDDKPANRAEHAALEGKAMPAIDVEGWINGTVTPADMKGKVVIVEFFATWCSDCMAAVPHNNELWKKYKDQGVVFVGVCTNKKGQEELPKTVKNRGIQYPVARDPHLISQTNWHVHYYPTYAIVDRQGVVRVVGLQGEHVEEVVKKLLAEPAGK